MPFAGMGVSLRVAFLTPKQGDDASQMIRVVSGLASFGQIDVNINTASRFDATNIPKIEKTRSGFLPAVRRNRLGWKNSLRSFFR